ncbi:MAG: hypothetical protein ACI9DC_002986 [Gammaproteobacteria bacterium]|jgi:hypothetical protein
MELKDEYNRLKAQLAQVGSPPARVVSPDPRSPTTGPE